MAVPKPVPLRPCAFTLVEMLAVLATVLTIVGILMPVMNNAKGWARVIQCQANLRALQVGWLGYAMDNKKVLVSPEDTGWKDCFPILGRPGGKYLSWVDGSGGKKFSEASIKDGALWPYMDTLEAYRCPEDPGTGQKLRSYAASTTMGGNNGIFASFQHMVGKLDLVPKPATMFVMVEEDGSFADSWIMELKSGEWRFRDDVAWNDAGKFVWHLNRGQTFSYADGHAEYHEWQTIHQDAGDNGYWHMYDLVNEDLLWTIEGHSPHKGKVPTLPLP